MGLAGRKQKQRIPPDPRNLSWADDASRFGHSYLSKFGWDASQGLGPSGDGMKGHINVQQKLDMLGIGAQHQRDPNGLAWKQNKEFETLLRKLNNSVEQRRGADDEDAEEESGRERETAMDRAFVRAQEENVEGEIGNGSFVTAKKRKQKDRDGPDTSERTRKKSKEKRQKSSSDDSALDPTSEPPSVPRPEPIPKPRPMAHRARVRAAKRIAGKPASAISEILGIAPSSSVSTSTSTPILTPPSISIAASPPSLSLDNLTTSTKSVADYFKEKLLARSSFPSSPASSPSASMSSGSATPGLGATGLGPGLSNIPSFDDDGEPPRRGIGSRAPLVNGDGQDVLTEKQRRKAERKAEKRKRREAEATQAISESMSIDVKEQREEDGVERLQGTSKKQKKQKKRREQGQQGTTDQLNDDAIKKSHEHDTSSGWLPEPSKKSEKEHRKRSSRTFDGTGLVYPTSRRQN